MKAKVNQFMAAQITIGTLFQLQHNFAKARIYMKGGEGIKVGSRVSTLCF